MVVLTDSLVEPMKVEPFPQVCPSSSVMETGDAFTTVTPLCETVYVIFPSVEISTFSPPSGDSNVVSLPITTGGCGSGSIISFSLLSWHAPKVSDRNRSPNIPNFRFIII